MILAATGTRPSKFITVCDSCLRASCWQGILHCEDAQSSGTIDLPPSVLRLLAREHEDWGEGSGEGSGSGWGEGSDDGSGWGEGSG